MNQNKKEIINILIPARGGSKRIPKKNIYLLKKKPLIAYTIEKALQITNNVYVSTENEEIATISKLFGAQIIERPIELAGDFSNVCDTVKHFLEKNKTDILVLLQATSPLVKKESIINGIKLMEKYDTVISVTEERSFFWDLEKKIPTNYEINNKLRTQDMNPLYKENGAFYITRKKNFIKNNNLIDKNIGFIVLDKDESIDIDTIYDLKFCEFMLTLKDR